MTHQPAISRLAAMTDRASGILLGATAFKSYLSIGDRFVVAGTNFLTLVILGRACGLEELGIFSLAWTVLLAVNAIQEAFVLTPFTVYAGKLKEAARRRYAGTALAFQFTLAGLATLVTAAVVAIMSVFGADPLSIATASCLILAIPATSLREFARRYLFARLSAGQVFLLDSITALLQFCAIGTLWFHGALTPGLTLLCIAAATGVPALAWFAVNRSRFSIPRRALIATEAGKHWRFGRWLCAGQISDLSMTHGIGWLVATMAGTAATGLFAACNSIVMAINPLVLGLGNILLPRAAWANHHESRDAVNRIIWKATAFLTLSVGLVTMAIALNGEFLVGLLYAFETLDGVQQIVLLLAIANFISAASFAFDNGLLVVNRPDVNLAASLVGLVITLVLATALTPHYGVAGTAVGILVGTLFNSLFQLVAFSRLVGTPAGLIRGYVGLVR